MLIIDLAMYIWFPALPRTISSKSFRHSEMTALPMTNSFLSAWKVEDDADELECLDVMSAMGFNSVSMFNRIATMPISRNMSCLRCTVFASGSNTCVDGLYRIG